MRFLDEIVGKNLGFFLLLDFLANRIPRFTIQTQNANKCSDFDSFKYNSDIDRHI